MTCICLKELFHRVFGKQRTSIWGLLRKNDGLRSVFQCTGHLVGLVVKASASRAQDPNSIPAFPVGIIPGRVITVAQETGTLVATLPRAWGYRVRAWTGRSGVSILLLSEIESLIYNFYLNVAARTFVLSESPCDNRTGWLGVKH